MSKELQIAQRLMLRGADVHLTSTPNIESTVNNIRRSPEDFNARIGEFSEGVETLSTELSSSNTDRMDYFNVFRLRNELEGRPLPTLAGIIDTKDRLALSVAQDTFRDINERINRGEWQFPTQVTDQGQLTSGLLIEGYGLFLKKLYDTPELSRVFVLAFEEVLWHKFQGSNILKDVLPWMIEERSNFAVRVERGLEKLTH